MWEAGLPGVRMDERPRGQEGRARDFEREIVAPFRQGVRLDLRGGEGGTTSNVLGTFASSSGQDLAVSV